MMAEAARAAKKEHGGGNDGSENHRVVAGSAGHSAIGKRLLAQRRFAAWRLSEDPGTAGCSS